MTLDLSWLAAAERIRLADHAIIRTSAADFAAAARVGHARDSRANARGSEHRAALVGEDSGLRNHTLGALGELVVARYLGIPWSESVDTFTRELDVGRFEVRTRSTPEAELIIRPRDPDARVYVLVVPEPDSPASWYLLRRERRWPAAWRVAGWKVARDGKRQEWQRDPGGRLPAFFVPQTALRFPDELR